MVGCHITMQKSTFIAVQSCLYTRGEIVMLCRLILRLYFMWPHFLTLHVVNVCFQGEILFMFQNCLWPQVFKHPLCGDWCKLATIALLLLHVPSSSSQLRSALSAIGSEELSKVKEQLDVLAQCFQLEDDDETEGNEEKSERSEEVKKLVEGFGPRVKVERLLKVRHYGLFTISWHYSDLLVSY